jgi:glycosyltransferase involved in cell wall biosynthesis
MSRLAVQNRVVYFEPGRNPDRPVFPDSLRNLPNFFTLRARGVQENLTAIQTPTSLPYARRHLPRSVLQITTPWVAAMNARILVRKVRQVMKAFAVQSPILWLYAPRHIDLLGKFGEKLVCYFVYDEYADFTGNRRIKELLRQYDNRMSSQADIVFTSSQSQWELRRPLNPNTYFIPNGVDFDLFHRALDPQIPFPLDIVGLKKPIIGCVGWLGYQIDVDLLLRVAQTCSNCSLVLIGPDELPSSNSLSRLRDMPNVHFLGCKELPSLPGYLRAFDVALIPYRLAGHALAVYPLKLHEYLAAGRAIVAVPLPELRPYGHVVRIAETQDEFVCQVAKASNDYSPEAVEARVSVARENTWDQRVAKICSVVEQHLIAKQGEKRPI